MSYTSSGNEEFARLLKEAQERLEYREQLVKELSADTKPVKFSKSNGLRALVSVSTYTSQWRITYLDFAGKPSGHTDHFDKASAVGDILTQGYVVDTARKVTPPEAPASKGP